MLTIQMRKLVMSLVALILAATSINAQWPQWRGPNRDGIAPAASVPPTWPEKVTLKWKQPVGEGYSSPVVDGGRVFVHSRRDLEEIVSALADVGFVYGLSSRRKGQLFCLDAKTGTAKWTTEGRAAQNAALVSAGPNLLVLTSDGDLLVVKRSPERFEEVRRYKVAETQTWSPRSCSGISSSSATPIPSLSGRCDLTISEVRCTLHVARLEPDPHSHAELIHLYCIAAQR